MPSGWGGVGKLEGIPFCLKDADTHGLVGRGWGGSGERTRDGPVMIGDPQGSVRGTCLPLDLCAGVCLCLLPL